MTRIVLADDNQALIRSLAQAIPWGEHGIEVVGCAFNGEEALALLDNSVDVLVTDIKMPRMDGIALTNWVAEHLPDIRVIFLSAHHEFEYAVHAIKMRVSDYVSKPVNHELLIETIQKTAREKMQALESRERLKAYLPYVRERVLSLLLSGGPPDTRLEAELPLLFPGWQPDTRFLCVVFDCRAFSAASESCSVSDQYGRVCDLHRFITKALEPLHAAALVLNEHTIAGVLSFPCEPDEGMLGEVLKCVKQAIQAAKAQGVELIAGMSAVGQDARSLGQMYHQAIRALSTPSRLSDSAVRVSASRTEIPQEQLDRAQRVLAIANAMAAEHDRVFFLDRLLSMLRALEAVDDTHLFTVTAGCALGACVRGFLSDTIPSQTLYVQWMTVQKKLLHESKREGLDALELFIRTLSEERFQSVEAESKSIVEEIYKAIRKVRYDSNGGLPEIARQVRLSPSYVSMIFKQQTGRNIIDCIQSLRLERAKELLADERMKVYEISEQIGYVNQYYFSAWFKKYTGLTPSEYRRQLQEAKGEA